jgi:hypothetical protein
MRMKGVFYDVSVEELKRRQYGQSNSVDRSSVRQAVNRGPDSVKLKNLHC